MLILSFIAGLIGAILFIYSYKIADFKYPRLTGISFLLALQFVVCLILYIISGNIEIKNKRNALISVLNRTDLKLKLNDSDLDSVLTSEIIDILKTIKDIQPHHSSPNESFLISIVTMEDTVTIELRRDSYILNEYWIFPEKESTEIGRVKTDHYLFEKQPEKLIIDTLCID